jgi:hypothetical protein
LAGNVNFYPLADVLRAQEPVVFGLQESSPTHVVTANRARARAAACARADRRQDLLAYLTGALGYTMQSGLPENHRSVGVALGSVRQWVTALSGNCSAMTASTTRSLTRSLCEQDVVVNATQARRTAAHRAPDTRRRSA